jgi:hypothetical protein
MVTLFIAVPLLAVASLLYRRASLRSKVLLSGTLAYFLYTYTSLAMLAAYNELFLLYVALFSMSLFAFVMTVGEIDIASLPSHFSERFPRRSTAGFAFFLGAVLALMWLGRIIPALLSGATPFGLESYTTLVIQVLDLGVIVPTAIVAGVLLLKEAPFGYLLSSVILVKGFSMGAAVSAMVLMQMLAGVEMSPVEAAIFPIFTATDIGFAVLMLRSLTEAPAEVIAEHVTPARSASPTGTGATVISR